MCPDIEEPIQLQTGQYEYYLMIDRCEDLASVTSKVDCETNAKDLDSYEISVKEATEFFSAKAYIDNDNQVLAQFEQ